MTTIQQRPLRGSRISSFYPVKSLPSLASLDSAFQLQEYISLLIRLDVHDVNAIVSVPGKGGKKDKESSGAADGTEAVEGEDLEKERKSEISVDEACWIYEQLRRLAQDLSHPLITMLQQECTRASCPEMKAGEWLYLCVAHGNDGAMEQCCAIDYILHTLDSATALLNSPRAFPSRLQIPQTSHRHFSSLARRLGRIFAHAYFHHREAFEQAEAESSLYARFLALTSKFDLVPAEFLVIPPRLTLNEGSNERGEGRRDIDVQPPRLLAAAVDPQRERRQRGGIREAGSSRDEDWDQPRASGSGSGGGGGGGGGNDRVKEKSQSPPGLGHPTGNESPRKFGRNRTDTMVFSEAFSVVEELARAEEEANTSNDRGRNDSPEQPESRDRAESSTSNSAHPEPTPIPPTSESTSKHEDAEDAGKDSDLLESSLLSPPPPRDAETNLIQLEPPNTTEVNISAPVEITPSSSTVPQNISSVDKIQLASPSVSEDTPPEYLEPSVSESKDESTLDANLPDILKTGIDPEVEGDLYVIVTETSSTSTAPTDMPTAEPAPAEDISANTEPEPSPSTSEVAEPTPADTAKLIFGESAEGDDFESISEVETPATPAVTEEGHDAELESSDVTHEAAPTAEETSNIPVVEAIPVLSETISNGHETDTEPSSSEGVSVPAEATSSEGLAPVNDGERPSS